jgi:fructuronate reductase
MLTLCASSLSDRDGWKQAGVRLPAFDRDAMITSTRETPVWLHFGAGNIFRGFVARIGQELLNKGLATTGIIAVDSFDYEIIEKIYRPFDHLTLMADLASDGNIGYEIIGSVADAICADVSDAAQWEKLEAVFRSPSLQVVSFTVTEKGYSLNGLSGELLPIVERDIFEGPEHACHLMSVVTALLLERFHAGATPIAISCVTALLRSLPRGPVAVLPARIS